MSEERPTVPSFSGQPSNDGKTSQAEAEQGSEQPETFTRKEAEDFLNQRLETFGKEIQSRTDKSLHSVLNPVREKVEGISSTLDFLKEQGVEITPEQEKALESAALKDGLLGGSETEGPSGAEPGDDQEDQPSSQVSSERSSDELDPFQKEAVRIMEQVGVMVSENDPEAKIISESDNLADYYENVKRAAEQKKQRLDRLPQSTGIGGGKSEGSVMDFENDANLWNEIKDEI